jgi:hypothetical protein
MNVTRTADSLSTEADSPHKAGHNGKVAWLHIFMLTSGLTSKNVLIGRR